MSEEIGALSDRSPKDLLIRDRSSYFAMQEGNQITYGRNDLNLRSWTADHYVHRRMQRMFAR